MKRIFVVISVIAMLGIASSAFATGETANATLTVSGTLSGSISVTIGSGTATASNGGTIALGTVNKFGTVSLPAGFTRSNTNTSPWRVGGGTFTVTVNQANVSTSANGYALTAGIGSASASGITWTLGVSGGSPVSSSVDLSSGTAQDVYTSSANAGAYGSASTYTLNIDFTDAATAASFTKTITFAATAN